MTGPNAVKTLLHGGRGDHRLAIATLLEIEEIPVLVRRRHARWQSIRDELSTGTQRLALIDRARANLEHPDVCELHGFNSESVIDDYRRRIERYGPRGRRSVAPN